MEEGFEEMENISCINPQEGSKIFLFRVPKDVSMMYHRLIVIVVLYYDK